MDEKRLVQKELFEEFAHKQKRKQPKAIFASSQKNTATFSIEHIIIGVIALIILGMIIFSAGVERGKRVERKKRKFKVEVEVKKSDAAIEKDAARTNKVDAAPLMTEKTEPLKSAPKLKEKRVTTLYTIQLASYLKEETAANAASALKEDGHKAFVRESGKYFTVCVGEFKEKQKARKGQDKLSRLYPDCYVRRR
ncbi:SPOR domain-containing protein [Candidatus Omnitrophota bacterium]